MVTSQPCPALPTLPHELHRQPLSANGCDLVLRMALASSDAAALLQVINWAFRGKPGVQQWTGEAHLIRSPRMTLEGVHAMLHHAEQEPATFVVMVAVKQFHAQVQPPPLVDAGGIEHCMLADGTQLVGCCKLERLLPSPPLTHDGRDAYRQQLGVSGTACDFGLLSVDPSETQQRIGRIMMDYAQQYAYHTMHCRDMYLWVIAMRSDILQMYAKLGFSDTLDRNPFDVPGLVWHEGVDTSQICFAILRKSLQATTAELPPSASPPTAAVAPTALH